MTLPTVEGTRSLSLSIKDGIIKKDKSKFITYQNGREVKSNNYLWILCNTFLKISMFNSSDVPEKEKDSSEKNRSNTTIVSEKSRVLQVNSKN